MRTSLCPCGRNLLLLPYFFILWCLLASLTLAAQDEEELWPEWPNSYKMYRVSVSADNLGYTALSKWLRANGSEGIDHVVLGVSFDFGVMLEDAWGELGFTGMFPGNEQYTQFMATVKGGPRFLIRRISICPGIGVGWGTIEVEGVRLPNYSCPNGDCLIESGNFWAVLHLGQVYRFPSRRRTSIMVGSFFQSHFRVGRNRWEYGYYYDDVEWVGIRAPEVPSTPRVLMRVGVTMGLAVTPAKGQALYR